MPTISRTERETTVQGTPQPYATGDTQAIARGLHQLGNGLASLQGAADQQADYEYKMKFSEFAFQQQRALDEAQFKYNPATDGDPKDFDANWYGSFQPQADQFLQQFSGRTQQKAALAMQQLRTSLYMKAQNARQGFVTQSNLAMLDAYAGRVATTMDGSTESVTRGLQALDGAIDQIPGITPRMRNVAREHAAKALWQAWSQKATPEQMQQALKQFDEGVDTWRDKFSSMSREVPAGDVHPGSRFVRQDTALDGRTAAVRYNNPGAMYPSAAAEKYGMTGYGVIGGGHKIAMFPSDVHGGAANMDNFARHYRGLTLAQAVTKWRGGNGSLDVPAGFDPGQVVDDAFLADKGKMTRFFDLMSRHEGRGSSGPVSRDTWGQAFEMFRAGGVGGVKAQRETGQTQAPQSEDTAALDGEVMASRKEREMLQLPERATIGDHAINVFHKFAPSVRKIVDAELQKRQALQWVKGVMDGTTQFNKYDAEGRKLIDQVADASGIGQKVYEGDPAAAASASQLAIKMQYTPTAVWNGLRGLTESPDAKKRALGWTVIQNMVDRNPSIFEGRPDSADIMRKAEHLRVLAGQHGMEQALKMQAEMDSPEYKRAHKAVEKDVTKFLKPYGTMAEATKQIASEMGPGWYAFWSSSPEVGGASARQREAMVADYKDLLKYHYEATGDETKAKAYALSDFKKKHGESTVTGTKTVMPYPPERFYPPVEGSHDYIKKDLEKTVGTYVPDLKKGSIAIIADRRTQSEIATGAPSYLVQAESKDGRIHVLPGRFRPDVTAAQAEIGKKFATERAKVQESRKKILEMMPVPPAAGPGVP